MANSDSIAKKDSSESQNSPPQKSWLGLFASGILLVLWLAYLLYLAQRISFGG